MRIRIARTLGVAGLVLVVVGCVSLKRTPEARFFVLQSLVEPPLTASARQPVAIVGVEKIRMPDHLERPQLVTWTGSSELQVDEFLRWAEPLGDGINRAITENLAGLLPDYQVMRRPWPGRVRTRCRVAVTLRVFGLQPDGTVRLEGVWALLPHREQLAFEQKPVSLSRGPLPAGPEGAPPDPGVDAMNELLAELSRQIADAIQALPPEVADPETDVADLEEDVVESEKVENR